MLYGVSDIVGTKVHDNLGLVLERAMLHDHAMVMPSYEVDAQ